DDYLWSSGGNTASISVSPTVDTEYYVTVTGINLCQDVDTVEINVLDAPETPEIPVGITNRCSAAATDTFTVSGVTNAVNYIWETDISGFGSISSNDTMAIIQWSADFYGELELYVTVENICGSETSAHLVITSIETPYVNLGDDQTICEGDSLYLEGPENATYTWSNGLDTQGIWVNTSNIYWIEASNNGCSSTDSIEVFTSDPEFSFAEDTIFTDLPYVLHSATGFDTYLWSTNETGESITVNEPGWYSVSMWNEYGCEVSDSVFVDDFTEITLQESFIFSLYPNPASHATQFRASSYPCTVAIYTITGNPIKRLPLESDKQIDLEPFAPGTYLIEVKTQNQTIKKRLVVL
ncbi:MAG: T9SS type A sorting domain-containing protein, partial [Bacteroidales bacterium]|nr:T9SS type A sorting domain-containing protein [Bacteroidales bacterium]